MSILLADDDVHLATFLSKSLESEGYSVHTALNEDTVIAELQRQNYKLIILDLNFGETDGLQLLQRLRSAGLETPVMVLSARNRIADRIQSFNLGADDYITKPFSFQELAARAHALLRRKVDPGLNVLRVENLELDPSSRKVHRGKREIKLSPKEFELLFLLMRHAGETVSRQDLLRESWGPELESDSNLVDVYVNYLRKKVDSIGEDKLIYTVRGEGYRIGRQAPLRGAGYKVKTTKQAKEAPVQPGQAAFVSEAAASQQVPLRALIHSLAHDLAQPLSSVRFFLEMMGVNEGGQPSSARDLSSVEQQADRASALVKGISALTREIAPPATATVPLDSLLDDVLNDFIVLLNSGLLAVERRLDPSIQVTSSPMLRHLLVLFVSKLIGRNSKPLLLTIAAQTTAEGCLLELNWSAGDPSQTPAQTSRTIFSRDLPYLADLARFVAGDLALGENFEIRLKLFNVQQHVNGRQELLN
jgi:DNA-binding response OmpR family regulator